MSKEVMQQLLEFLGRVTGWNGRPTDLHNVKIALQAALADPTTEAKELAAAYERGWNAALAEAGEPAAHVHLGMWRSGAHHAQDCFAEVAFEGSVPLYTHPPRTEPVAQQRDYCEEKLKPGGCQLPNVHCGFPACNTLRSVAGRALTALRHYTTPAKFGGREPIDKAVCMELEKALAARPEEPS